MIITLTLPKNAHLKAKKGEIINFGDPLYEIETCQEIIINIVDKLGIKPENIFRYVVKIIGEQVKKGELLAKKKELIRTKKIYSDYNGLIREINHQTGEVLLAVDINDQKIIRSNFKGVIDDIRKNQLKIKIENGKEFELKDINQNGGGEVFYFKEESFFFSISEEQIENKIIVVENLKAHIEAKCEALDCSGFLFLGGNLPTNLPAAKIKNIDDYQQIVKLEKKYTFFSKEDKMGIVYD